MDEKKIIRKCAACNALKSRDNFIKITVNKSKEIKIMPDSKFFGRSVYICKNSECVQKALKKNRIYRILRVNPDKFPEEKIRAVLEN